MTNWWECKNLEGSFATFYKSKHTAVVDVYIIFFGLYSNEVKEYVYTTLTCEGLQQGYS